MPISAAAVPTAMNSLLAPLGVSSGNIIGVPLGKASMDQDISFAITQSASTFPCYLTLQNISKIVKPAQLISGVYVVLSQPMAYNNAQMSTVTYTVYDNTGVAISSPGAIEYTMPNEQVDCINALRTAYPHPVKNQLTPEQAIPLALYVISDSLANPLLVTTATGAPAITPYPQAFFLQYSATGQVSMASANPTGGSAASLATLITNVTNDVQAPLVGAAAMIQSYGSVALSNSTSPVNAYANAAITASWNVIYDLYALVEQLNATVAQQLPASLKRPTT